MSKALVIIKSMGIGDLCILISNIHAISKKIDKPVKVLAQKSSRATAILKHDPHIEEVIELNEKEIKGFFSVIKKIKPKIKKVIAKKIDQILNALSFATGHRDIIKKTKKKTIPKLRFEFTLIFELFRISHFYISSCK